MSLQNNSVHVDPASATMSLGQVAEIKQKAMTQVTVAEQTQREAQTNVAKSTGGAEGNVYGALATEALMPGSKIVSSVMEFIDARRSDTNGVVDNTTPTRTMDDDIKTAMRAPGVYRAEPEGSTAYDGLAANSAHTSLKLIDGGKSTTMDVFEKASVASTSLKDNDAVNLKSWDIPPKTQAAVAEAKQALTMTHDVKMANEVAYNSALVAEQQQSAIMYKVAQAAPNVPGLGNSMAGGPKIRPADLLNQIEQTTITGAA